jgi:hypothetical protein
LNGIYFVLGELAIGEDAAEAAQLTVFQDSSGQVLVWGNGLVETGFHALRFNLGNASTDIDITGATFDCIGKANNDADRGYTSTEDSRLLVEAVGTSGALDIIQCTFKNTQSVTLTSACIIDTCDIETELLVQGSAEIKDTVIRTTSAANVATLQDPSFGASTLHHTEFVQQGAGHAIEIDSTGTYTFTNLFFTDYGADDSSSAALFINVASGTVTINVSDGDTPTYRLPGGSTATVEINNTVNITLTGLVATSEVTIVRTSDETVLFHVESSGTSETYGHDGTTVNVDILVFHVDYEPVAVNVTLGGSASSIPIQQIADLVYLNP